MKEGAKRLLPARLVEALRQARDAVAFLRLAAREGRRWRAIASAPTPSGGVHVSYGWERVPGRDEVVYGGMIKFQVLAAEIPHEPRDFNLLYLGSSSMPVDGPVIARLARRRGVRLVWNQNGVAYPGWFGPGFERINRPRARLLHDADHVIFQSAFCKLSADRFYGERRGPWEVLHNPVDIRHFTPAPRPKRPLTLVLGGNQYQSYRFESALATLAAVRAVHRDARLLVTGDVWWSVADDVERERHRLIRKLGLDGGVELIGAYTQDEAPGVLRRADILLHTKYNDPCPTVVLEAMACGLPVVYSASGGTPELVGVEAGVGIDAPLDWEHDHPPDPEAMAAAVVAVAARLSEHGGEARARAERFDARRWVERHRQIFAEVLG